MARSILRRIAQLGHRIETHRPGGHVRISSHGEILADSHDAVELRETGLPARWYLPREDVRAELVPSDTRTHCPFKGDASYFSVKLPDGEVLEDLVWSYPEAREPAREVEGLLCFYAPERAKVEVG